jgi:hypothetical protein
MSNETEKVVAKYIELRDRKGELKKEYDTKVSKIDAAMDTIETYLMTLMDTLGVDSMKIDDVGTAFKTTRVKASFADRDLARKFVLDTQNLDLLELRASSTGVKQYLEEHKELPPGFNAITEQSVTIRRAS